jgi:translocation and assembly module TamB
VALALVLLLALAAYLFVSTPPGERYVRARLVDAVNQALPGNVELGDLDISGTSVVLTDVVLRDPEGEVVARVPRIEATLGITNFSRAHVDVHKVRLIQPEVYLRIDDRGFNLTRAVRAAVEDRERKAGTAIVRLRDVKLEGGRVQLLQHIEPAIASELRAEDVRAEGELIFADRTERLGLAIALSGRATTPVQERFSVDVRMDRKGPRGADELRVGLGGMELQLGVNSEDAQRQEFKISRLVMPPDTLRAFVPAWPLTADASLTGTARRSGSVVQLDLHGSAADARVEVKGGIDVAKLHAQDLLIDARDLDLAQLLEGGPKSRMSFNLRANGGGKNLDSLDGSVDLSMPESAIDDQQIGPIEVHATARESRLQVSSFRVNVPGLTVDGRGEATRQSLSFEGTAVAKDLSRLGSSLGRIVRRGGVPISGEGTLSFRLKGPVQYPAINIDGRFASLGYEDVRLEGLSIQAALPDVRRPLNGNADLRAGLVAVGRRRFRDVRAQLVTRGRELVADLSARGFADVAVHVAGTLERSAEALLVSDLKVRYPEATWTLQRPTRLAFGGGQLTASELTLESGRQRLSIDGGMFGERLDARARIENLMLERLPRAFLPDDLNLGGQVNAAMRAAGNSSRPEVAAKLELRNGRYRQLTDLGLELDATYARDRATGEIVARAFQSALKGSFDVPVRGLLTGTDEAISANLAVEATRLERLFAALGLDPGLQGSAAATLEVKGTALDPRVKLVVDGDQVKHRMGPPGDLDLVVESGPDGRLQARVDLDSMASESFLLIKTPWAAARFVRGKITGRMFLETPVELHGALRDFPLDALRAWGVSNTQLGGKGTLEFDTHGPILAPEGEVRLAIRQLVAGAMEPVDANLKLVAEPHSVQLTGTAARGAERLLQVGGELDGPLGALLQRASLHDVALGVTADIGPVSLAELQALAGDGREPSRERPDGIIAGRLELRGTPGKPNAVVTLRVEKLGVGERALGTVDVDYRYADATSRLVARLAAPSGGNLELDGRVVLDISSRALIQEIPWRSAPLQARVYSRDFDPAFLSNVSELIREVGGRIDADATMRGTLGAPALQGRVEWRDGRLALMGYGQYRRIHLLLEGSPDAIALQDLSAQSGGGQLKVSARGDRRGGAFQVQGAGELNRFPIIVDDQLRALLSTRFSLNGQATPELVSIQDLVIPEAQVELPEVRRKDLQELERPKDIVLVRKGEPLYKRRRKAPATGEGGAAGAGGAVDPARSFTGRRYVITVDAPRNIWVRGTDVNAEVGLSSQFRIELAGATTVFGEVRFLRGRVDVLGRRFDLLRDSQVRFTGPVQTPYINITAEHANEREAVNVFTTIRGQGKDVSVRVNSNPVLPESEIYTLLATGRRTLKRGSGTSMTGAEAASVVGSYAASQIKRVLASKLPLDVLSIEAGSEGLADASVEAGTYVTDKVYIGSVLRLGADPEQNENTAGFRVEYQFSPHWSFETEYGDARRGGADVIWSVDY